MNTQGSLDHDGLDGILTAPQKNSSVLKFLLALLFLVILLAAFWFYKGKLLAEFENLNSHQGLSKIENKPKAIIEPIDSETAIVKDFTTDLMATSAGPEVVAQNLNPELETTVQQLKASKIEAAETLSLAANSISDNEKIDRLDKTAVSKVEGERSLPNQTTNTLVSADNIKEQSTPVIEDAQPVLLPVKQSYLFYHEASEMGPLSSAEIEDLKQLVNSCNGSVMIVGHTCNLGDEQFNYYLGMQRAKAMQQFLIKQKVNPEILQIRSEGVKQPVASNATWTGRKLNRRVELYCDTAS